MNATPVSKEEVRLLAIELGVREAARRCGLSESTVKSWSTRHKWLVHTPHANSPKAVASTASKPSTILLDELAENERETRLSLSRYARRASRDAEGASLKDAPYVKQAAQVGSIAFNWGSEKESKTFTLNVLNLGSLDIQTDQS